jgi:hypothetical protein
MNTRIAVASEMSGAFVVCDPQWRSKIFWGGLLLLLVHPVGWPVALGYRKALIANLADGKEPVLPDWQGKVPFYFFEGLKAMGVIFGYLSPLYLALLLLSLKNGMSPDSTWLYTAAFFVVFTMFSTLSFPIIVLYLTFFSENFRLSWPMSLMLLMAFTSIIFFIPAGFLQVSKSGKYLSAFNLFAAAATLRSHFVAYCLAWYRSGIMSLIGHFSIPFAPWGVFWCYLSIIYEFNSILHTPCSNSADPSWYSRLREKHRLIFASTSNPLVFQCLNPSDAIPCFMIKVGPVMIPLPKCISKYLELGV